VVAYQEQHRQHTLTDAEVRTLWGELDRIEAAGQAVPFAQAIKLLLLTGCRLNEVLSARWNWLDFDRQLVRLPDSKTGARDVHLPDDAMVILRSCRVRRCTCCLARQAGRLAASSALGVASARPLGLMKRGCMICDTP